ncbi:MAG: ATP-binding protein [Pseudomonadota bacterium]
MSFRLKTILGIALIEALLLTILIVSGLHYLRSSNEQQLLQRANTTAKLVATMTGDSVVAVDLATLDVLVEQTLRNPDIVYLRIRNNKGASLSEGGEPQSLAEDFQSDLTIEDTKNDNRLDVSAPIVVAKKPFGQVEIGISTARLEATLSNALKWMAGIAISEMVLVALLGIVLGTYLTHQLQKIQYGAKKVASGDFGHQIPIKGKDELADTALSFNRMSQSLKEYARIAEDARRRAEAGRELAESTLHDALNSMRDGVLIVSGDNKVALANSAYRQMYSLEEIDLDNLETIVSSQMKYHTGYAEHFVQERLAKLQDPSSHPRWESHLNNDRHLLVAQHPMSRGGVVVVETDVTELYEALEENKKLQLELMQKHKTEALGTLAGGIAHEINTPIQFISSNVTFLAESLSDIFDMIEGVEAQDMTSIEEFQKYFKQQQDYSDWKFIKEEVPGALAEMSKGSQHIQKLISDFKQFAAPISENNELVDLVKAIETTLDIGKSKWKEHAEIKLNAPDIMPLIPCKISQINQVIHSLISNAVHAIEDGSDDRPGEITVRIDTTKTDVLIEIHDNGCGIAVEHQSHIFDTLFTTKDPGRGTGNGLALCKTIIERNHNGKLTFESFINKGTKFKISLPIASDASNSDANTFAKAS